MSDLRFLPIVAALAVVGLVFFWWEVPYTVDAGTRGVLLVWGKAQTNVMQPGMHFLGSGSV